MQQLSEFELHMEAQKSVFVAAYDNIIVNLRNQSKIDLGLFVIEAMKAVRNAHILDDLEKKEAIIDLVHKVVISMNIDYAQLEKTFFPMLDSTVDVLIRAAKGHLYLCKTIPKKTIRQWCIELRKKNIVAAAPTPLIDSDIAAIVSQTCVTVKSLIQQKTVNIATIMSISTIVMQVVETYPQITGPQKKQVAVQVLHTIVDTSTLTDNTKEDLNIAIDATVSSAIDFIVAAANGQIPLINDIKNAASGCITKC